jgi:hypothetical protein
MKTFRIAVYNISSFDVNAENKEKAKEIANRLLLRGDTDTMTTIEEWSSGWEVDSIADRSESS